MTCFYIAGFGGWTRDSADDIADAPIKHGFDISRRGFCQRLYPPSPKWKTVDVVAAHRKMWISEAFRY